jgi:hypothetical protein
VAARPHSSLGPFKRWQTHAVCVFPRLFVCRRTRCAFSPSSLKDSRGVVAEGISLG